MNAPQAPLNRTALWTAVSTIGRLQSQTRLTDPVMIMAGENRTTFYITDGGAHAITSEYGLADHTGRRFRL